MTGVLEIMNEDAKAEQVASLWGGASREDLQSERNCTDHHNSDRRTQRTDDYGNR